MVLFEWPRPPFILGLVLGGIAENNLWISTAAYGASWLVQPSIIVIFLIIVSALGYSIFKNKMRKEQSLSTEET